MTINLNIAQAELPKTYEAAKATLEGCNRIDECKRWSDRAEALGGYARIVDDNALFLFAHRVRARAVRRAGHLLKYLDGRGAHMKKGPASLTQRQAAEQAGLSPDQQKQAVRVATVPHRDFEALIEGDSPPTITALADLGTRHRHTPKANRP